MDDSLLVSQAKEGNREAFTRLMELHQTKVYNLALRMTGSPEDAADLSQEAFLNAWRGLSSFQGHSTFSTWLYRLTSNACIDFLRREKRRQGSQSNPLSLEEGEVDSANLISNHAPSPQAILEGKELKEAIRKGLEQLSPEHRQVLILREVVGLSYGEIAATANLEEGTVKSRIARARLSLRNILRSGGNFSVSSSSTKTEPTKGGDGNELRKSPHPY